MDSLSLVLFRKKGILVFLCAINSGSFRPSIVFAVAPKPQTFFAPTGCSHLCHVSQLVLRVHYHPYLAMKIRSGIVQSAICTKRH